MKQRALELPVSESEKLVLKEPIGKGAFGTVYKGDATGGGITVLAGDDGLLAGWLKQAC